jgi:predicted transcriptional regulator
MTQVLCGDWSNVMVIHESRTRFKRAEVRPRTRMRIFVDTLQVHAKFQQSPDHIFTVQCTYQMFKDMPHHEWA